MKFRDLFRNSKPIFGMIHLNSNEHENIMAVAKREVEIYLSNGVCPLIENYFGSSDDCEEVLKWLHSTHPDAIYGINILGDAELSFQYAEQYGAKFVQIDSVSGHLDEDLDEEYGIWLKHLRKKADVVLLGGVRFKYQPVASGRSLKEDLLIGKERCDAVVCTGSGTGLATPFEKVGQFKEILGDFPVIVGAGVTLHTAEKTAKYADGVIIGSWLKHNHRDDGFVEEENVKRIVPFFS